jgi:hypothetical protein
MCSAVRVSIILYYTVILQLHVHGSLLGNINVASWYEHYIVVQLTLLVDT